MRHLLHHLWLQQAEQSNNSSQVKPEGQVPLLPVVDEPCRWHCVRTGDGSRGRVGGKLLPWDGVAEEHPFPLIQVQDT